MIDPKEKELSMSKQCQVLQIHRSGLYYKPMPINALDDELMHHIDELHTMDPTIGTRRMKKMLENRGFKVGRRHVRSLMRKMRIRVIYCQPRTTIIDPAKYKYPYLLRGIKAQRPNHIWAIDITYIPMVKGFMYMVAIIDLYSRYIVNWSISNTMEAKWVVDVVKEAVEKHGKPDIMNSDQGSQFTSDLYINYIKSLEHTKISMDGKGRALDNIFIERFWRTIKYDKINIVVPENGLELFKTCQEFIEYYNQQRPHKSIDYQTPISYYQDAA
jgi:putative transposase